MQSTETRPQTRTQVQLKELDLAWCRHPWDSNPPKPRNARPCLILERDIGNGRDCYLVIPGTTRSGRVEGGNFRMYSGEFLICPTICRTFHQTGLPSATIFDFRKARTIDATLNWFQMHEGTNSPRMGHINQEDIDLVRTIHSAWLAWQAQHKKAA